MTWPILNDDQQSALKEIIDNESAEKKSDRILAIIGGAILDDSLRRALEFRLRQPQGNENNISEKLFKVTGPLGNLVPKIDLGYLMYMYEKPIRNAMYGVSDIRNLFAHKMSLDFSSTSKKMEEAFNKLKAHEGISHYPTLDARPEAFHRIGQINNRRELFIENLKISLFCLMYDFEAHTPWSNVPKPRHFPVSLSKRNT